MSKHMISKFAVCPYYRHENAQVIYCDGPVDDSVIHLAFSNRSDAFAYKRRFCQGGYRKCEIYMMLEKEK